MIKKLFNIIALSTIIFQLHCSQAPSTILPSKVEFEPTDIELKQFGAACNKLPYALWLNMLNFLLGEHHTISLGIDPRIMSDLRQSNRVKIDDYGVLKACYKDQLYAWNPSGMDIAPHKSWRTQRIPKGWSLDRFEHGSVVLINDAHNRIKILNDTNFKEQAAYALPENSLFWVASEGRTLVHCAHPLVTKAPITNVQVVHTPHEYDTKTRQSSYLLRMPPGGIMPPMTIDESGRFFTAHAAEKNELYLFNLRRLRSSTEAERIIKFSERSISPQSIPLSMWKLRHPETHQYQDFAFVVLNNIVNARSVVDITPALATKDMPFFQLYFAQILPTSNKNYHALGEINFTNSTSRKTGPVITSLSLERGSYENEDKENKMLITYLFHYWDSGTGDCLRSLKLTSNDNTIPDYSVDKSGRIALCNGTECHLVTPNSDIRLLACDKGREQVSNVRISPSGDWVFLYNHMTIPTKSPYALVFPRIYYLGGERMKYIKAESNKIDRRKFMMRLFALQQVYEFHDEELLPPREMQEAIEIEGAKTSNKSCIIS